MKGLDLSGTVRLGLLTPLTGLVDIYGNEISNGARIACDEVNEAGGINGQMLELIIADDGSIPETAVPAAIDLIENENCVALIGNLLSNSRIAVANEVAEPYKIPLLNFSFYEGSISSRYFFHFAALPNQQIDKMIPFMAKTFGHKFFFAGSNYEWPLGSIDAAKASLKLIGGETVGERYLPMGETDFFPLLDALGRSGADVFVPYFAGTDQVNLLTEFTRRGLKKRMAVVMGHYDEVMVSHLPASVREGFYSSNTYFMGIKSDENQKVLERLSALPGIDGLWPEGNGKLSNFGEGAYICVKAFAKAARQAGSTDPDILIPCLETVTVLAPQGQVTMDSASHHAQVNTWLSRCTGGGEFPIVESFGEIAPVIPKRYAHQLQSELPNTGPEKTLSGLINEEDPSHVLVGAVNFKETLLRMVEIETIYRGADVAIIATDTFGIIIQVNPFASQVFGYKPDELVGQSVGILIPPRHRGQHELFVNSFSEGKEDYLSMATRDEIFAYRKDGSEFPVEASVKKHTTLAGTIMVATVRDVTSLIKSREELFWQATHDSLTKLPNRALIQERIKNALSRIKRTGQKVALLFIDVDNFKLVNDSFGHDAGDQLLITVAERISEVIRAGDTVSRFGGDEFVVFCDQVNDTSAIGQLAERIIEGLRRPIDVGGQSISTTVSIGIAFGSDGHRPEDLMRNADGAMYVAKDSGRDGWQVFSDEIHEKAKSHLKIANGLRNAIEDSELSLVYQPIMQHSSGMITGAEALLRWNCRKQEILPADFIPVAESTGSIIPIGRWVFETACRQLSEWDNKGLVDSTFYISVNVSSRQFTNPDLVSEFEDILFDTEADPRRILLEITETALMANTDHNKSVLQELGNLGFQIAVDDFGTGYSSLSQLTMLPVNRLKIDQVFVQGIGENKKSEAVVAGIIQMAHALKLDVIAEGVETPEQLSFLTQAGCDDVQGFLFHRPLKPKDFERFCTKDATLKRLSSM